MQPPRNYEALRDTQQQVEAEQSQGAVPAQTEKSGQSQPSATYNVPPQWAMNQDMVTQNQSANDMVKRHAAERGAEPLGVEKADSEARLAKALELAEAAKAQQDRDQQREKESERER